MNAGLLAALLVMVIMTAFVFVMLNVLAINTGDKIRDNIVNQIKFYDEIVQKKESELQVLKEQIENEKSKLKGEGDKASQDCRILSNVYVVPEYYYINQEFVKDYRNIKNKIRFNNNKIVQEICNGYNHPKYQKNHQILEELADKFSLENVYKVSAFSEAEQLEIIGELLTCDEKEILNSYMLQNKGFHCLKFYQWLYVQRQIRDYTVYVNTAEKTESFNELGKLIQTRYDGNLCEGIQIYVGNRLYDYGIRKCELLS